MPSADQSGHSPAGKVQCQTWKEADYNAKVNLTTKVLDFVQLGGLSGPRDDKEFDARLKSSCVPALKEGCKQ